MCISHRMGWYPHLIMIIGTVCYNPQTTASAITAVTQNAFQQEPHSLANQKDPVSNGRNLDKYFLPMCPRMIHYIFQGFTPHDDANAGVFEEYSIIADEFGGTDLHACIKACCEKDGNDTCNVVFVFKRKCYHIHCVSNEACAPKEHPQVKGRLQMVLVNPVQSTGEEDNNLTWLDVLKNSAKSRAEVLPLLASSGNGDGPLNFWIQPHKYHYPESLAYDDGAEFSTPEKRLNQLLMSDGMTDNSDGLIPEDISYYNANANVQPVSSLKFISCNLESDLNSRCPPNEKCEPLNVHARVGVCKCHHGYYRNQLNECVVHESNYRQLLEDPNSNRTFVIDAAASEPLTMQVKKVYNPKLKVDSLSLKGEEIVDATAIPSDTNNKRIVVSVASKEVQLPEKEVTLAAFTVPEEPKNEVKYKYLWTLITQPKGPMNGTISDQSNSKVKLSNLSVGLYTFKIAVSGENGSYGEAMANVSVLPEKRINSVPQVIITPREQTIRQPTTNAILDGSTSTDDDKIISWHWEVVLGPIGYQPKLPEVNTLQLTDLTAPGNYTFKLTVVDSDNESNFTTANITVLKGTDYPPVANAGDAVILYLPNNNVTLNGTASSDDHEIVAWEWTKDASDEAKAVDMQNTRTPFVQLSNLEEGMYTFVLKVTDGSAQSSTAKVHVFVKPPTNTPPIAIADKNTTISLPRNWIILNGSRSVDDVGIKSFKWNQISGPKSALIKNSNASIANATSLTLGLYKFELNVFDENNNTAADSVWIKVIQEKNAPPVANAGGDQSITLPISALYLNGSNSSDDLAITKYVWTRDDSSLAAGYVIADSDKEQVLILTHLVPGRYVFKLTVYDEQGLTNSDTVSVIVHPDPMLLNMIQLKLPIGISVLSQLELNSIVQKIGLLLNDMKICMRDVRYDAYTEATILVFYAEQTTKFGKSIPVDGLAVEQLLKDKLQRDASILGTVFADVRTIVCQNKCSGHGVCNTNTRACMCEAFWMPSAGYFWGIVEPNCDWSILYVFVVIIVCCLILSGVFWGITCACKQSKKTRSRHKVQKYSLVGTRDEETPYVCRTTSMTDSETDSDVLFETRTKPNDLRLNGTTKKKLSNNHIQNRYASTKIGRRIKT